MIKSKTLFLFTLVIVVVIAYLSLAPKPTVTASNDKLGHFLAYGTLCVFCLRSLNLERKRSVLYIVVSVVCYGVLMEVGQFFIPGRHFSEMDLVANASGAFAGWILHLVVPRTGFDKL